MVSQPWFCSRITIDVEREAQSRRGLMLAWTAAQPALPVVHNFIACAPRARFPFRIIDAEREQEARHLVRRESWRLVDGMWMLVLGLSMLVLQDI